MTILLYPIKFKIHDLSSSGRGQGKRVKGMVMGAMAGRVGKSAEPDIPNTFHDLNDIDLEEVQSLNEQEFWQYYRLRNQGKNHDAAMNKIWPREE